MPLGISKFFSRIRHHHDQPAPRTPLPAPANTPVQRVAPAPVSTSVQRVVKTFDFDTPSKLLAQDAKSPMCQRFLYYLRKEDRDRLALTSKMNFQNLSSIVGVSLVNSTDRRSIELWLKQNVLANNELLQTKLKSLLTSFGITYPLTEDNKQQTLARIRTILLSLQLSHLLTDKEKRHFINLYTEEIFKNQKLLYLLLQTADRNNLVLLFENHFDLENTTFHQKVEIVRRYLENNGLTVIIKQISCSSPSLVTNIPNEICTVTTLQKLILKGTKISALPAEIRNLTDLEWLDLEDTSITDFPDVICTLTDLEWLDLSYNKIPSLPAEIGNLTKLEGLCVNNTELSVLPAEIGKLTRLTELLVNNTELSALPDEISNLTDLAFLRLRNTSITDFPDVICTLTDLQELDLSYNKIPSLPDEIGNLTKLEELYLNNNNILTLPHTIGELTELKELALGSMPIPGGNYKGIELEKMLTHNQIPTLPDTIGNLTELEEFYLSNTEIETLPDTIQSLRRLRVFEISKTPLETFLDATLDLVLTPKIQEMFRRSNMQNDLAEVFELKCRILASNKLLQTYLGPLCISFGITYPLTEDNKQQTLDRITTILNSLKRSYLFTDKEKRHFINLSAEEIFEKPNLLYLLLQTADSHNLLLLFKEICSSQHTTFHEKVDAVLVHLQQNRETIENVSCFSTGLTNIPYEVGNLPNLKQLCLFDTQISFLPDEIRKLIPSSHNLDKALDPSRSLASNQLLQTKLVPLLTSFGITYPCTEDNKQQTLDRITTILNPLKSSTLFTQDERSSFINLSAEEIFGNPDLLYFLLQTADRHNLLLLFKNNYPSRKPFHQKVEGVLSSLQNDRVYRENLSCSSTDLTNVPYEVCTQSRLKRLQLNNTQVSALPDTIGNLTNLQWLLLKNIPLTTLPWTLCKLTKLEELDFSDTQLFSPSSPNFNKNLDILEHICTNNPQIKDLSTKLSHLQNSTIFSFLEKRVTEG